MTKFLFDLDGTLTMQETLPLLAEHFQVREEIRRLTEKTVAGQIPFAESFRKRVEILRELPVDEVADFLEGVEVHPQLAAFIREHSRDCFIVTGNLSCWIWKLAKKIGCGCYASEAQVEHNRVKALVSVLQKEDVVREWQARGARVVFVGDGQNDVAAMRQADVAIASGLTHEPAAAVCSVADVLALDEAELYRQLQELLS